MKKLFYLLLALPLAFAACEPDTPGPQPEVNDPQLTLTSSEIINLPAEGGQGAIEYTLVNEKEGAEFTAEFEAEWISNFTFGETITFDVAANEATDAREAKVTIKYDVASMEVTVKQAGESEAPQPQYALDVKLAGGYRISSAEMGLENNYFVLGFADDAENIELGIILVGKEEETILQAGTYTSENETFGAAVSQILIWDKEEELCDFTTGIAVVGLNDEIYSFDVTLTDAEESVYHFTYEGVIMDMEPAEEPKPETFNPVKVTAYRSINWELGNFELALYIDNENYHSLDMQDIFNPNGYYLTAGNYTMANGGVTSWSNFLWNIYTGEGAYVTAADITLTHNEDGTTSILGYIESEYGDHLDINWSGVIEGFNFNGESQEEPTPSEDIEFHATYFACPYSATGTNHNYYIILSDVEASGSNNQPNVSYYFLDIYSDEVNDLYTVPNGTYTFDVNDTYQSGTMSAYYTYCDIADANGTPTRYHYTEGTATITYGKIEADFTREDGVKVKVIYEGSLSIQ